MPDDIGELGYDLLDGFLLADDGNLNSDEDQVEGIQIDL